MLPLYGKWADVQSHMEMKKFQRVCSYEEVIGDN